MHKVLDKDTIKFEIKPSFFCGKTWVSLESDTNIYTYHFIRLRYILQNTLCSPIHSSGNKALKVGVLLLFSD